MRNRDQFGPNPFDSYRGREWNVGTRESSHLYGAPSRHRDFSSHTYHTSDFSMGPHGHGDSDNLANRDTLYNAPTGLPRHNEPDRDNYRGFTRYSGYGGYHSEPLEEDYRNSGYRSEHDAWRDSDYDAPDRNRYYDRSNRGHSDRGWSSRNDYNQGWPAASNPEHYGHPRDWSERASDEVRSWFGDDEAERRRERDERYNRSWW